MKHTTKYICMKNTANNNSSPKYLNMKIVKYIYLIQFFFLFFSPPIKGATVDIQTPLDEDPSIRRLGAAI